MPELPEALRRMQEIQAKMKALGIGLENISDLTALIEEYGNAQEGLKEFRVQQFWIEASEIVYKMAGRRGDKTEAISEFLRQFAEHVAGEIIRNNPTGDIEKEVDRVKPMLADPRAERKALEFIEEEG